MSAQGTSAIATTGTAGQTEVLASIDNEQLLEPSNATTVRCAVGPAFQFHEPYEVQTGEITINVAYRWLSYFSGWKSQRFSLKRDAQGKPLWQFRGDQD